VGALVPDVDEIAFADREHVDDLVRVHLTPAPRSHHLPLVVAGGPQRIVVRLACGNLHLAARVDDLDLDRPHG